jgi:glycosyltransferase involved in cell wall biosynthesis
MNLSIVTSMYNEEQNVDNFLGELIETFKKNNSIKTEIIVVDNGSTDNTGKICDIYSKKYNIVKVIHAPMPTLGKGNGVSLGIKKASGKYIALTDSDLQQDPRDITKLLDTIKQKKYDFIIGWRKDRKDPLIRKIVSKFYNILVRIFFNVPVPDIAGQPRIFRYKVIEGMNIISKRWIIEVELPFKAKQKGFKIGYIQIKHKPRIGGTSNVKFMTIFEMFIDLIRFRLVV